VNVTIPYTPAKPKLYVQHEIIVAVNVTPRSNNPIAEYLSCNVLLDCESRELAFTALHTNLQNADSENTQNMLSD
jgi:hypothetical protein